MERIIIKSLFENNIYARAMIPFLKENYFQDNETQTIYKCISAYNRKYNTFPTYTVVKHAVSKMTTLNETTFKNIMKKVTEIEEFKNEAYDIDWLCDETETHCQTVAATNAVIESMGIIKDPLKNTQEIVKLVNDAANVSFKDDIGIEFFSDIGIQDRWIKYSSPVAKMASGITSFDKACGGGVESKSLNLFLGDTHSGKTTDMCALSAGYVKNGFNVLYITLEMAEEKIAQKHDANFLNVEINDIPFLKEHDFKNNIQSLKEESWGHLFVKELPTSTCNALHVKKVIEDIEQKKGIKLDIVFLDYLNLLLPIRAVGADSTYISVKLTAEELRGLAVIHDIAIWSGTQTNRSGAQSSDIQLTDTSESYGVPATADLMVAIRADEELREQNIQIWKILKNRFSGVIDYKFAVETQFNFGRIVDYNKDGNDLLVDLTNSQKNISMINKINTNSGFEDLKINITSEDVEDMSNFFGGEN